MCGGGGTRLWPASTESRPKQFIPLLGERSLFQDTALRVAALPGIAELIVIAGVRHGALLDRQLAEIGLEAVLLLEPEARDSGPAIAAAATWIARRDRDGVAVVVASDHHLPDSKPFQIAAADATRLAADGRIVTFGVVPRFASTAYGYIKPGCRRLSGFDVDAFIEKPDAGMAKRHIEDGCLWNSGNFVARASMLVEAFEQHCPQVATQARLALAHPGTDDRRIILGPAFRSAPKISFDYAVMEKTDRASVLPVDFQWSDLGAWSAVRDVLLTGPEDNSVTGDVLTLDSKGCLIRTDGPPVAAVGVRDLAIVVENGAVLVCDLASDQAVKAVQAQFRLRREPEVLTSDPSPEAERALGDLDQWLRTSALPLWWTLGADHGMGGFHEALSQAAAPVNAPRRLRVQARQAYVYARAGRYGWTGPWCAAVDHALEALHSRYLRPDGLYRQSVDAQGSPLDERAFIYEQAFVLLAFSEAARASPPGSDIVLRADMLRERLTDFRWTSGGFREEGPAPFQANCHMHLFEACLAWLDTDGIDKAPWRSLAEELARFAADRLLDAQGGVVREVFDEMWIPCPPLDGGDVEPGHQFEWAWLFSEWGRLGGDVTDDIVRRLYEAGRAGVDPRRKVAVNRMTVDFDVVDGSARLWPQTERVRIAERLWRTTGEPGYARDLVEAAEALKEYLDVPVRGLWRDRLLESGGFVEEPAPASSLYHLSGLLRPVTPDEPSSPRGPPA